MCPSSPHIHDKFVHPLKAVAQGPQFDIAQRVEITMFAPFPKFGSGIGNSCRIGRKWRKWKHTQQPLRINACLEAYRPDNLFPGFPDGKPAEPLEKFAFPF
jgi:hypothetical protein